MGYKRLLADEAGHVVTGNSGIQYRHVRAEYISQPAQDIYAHRVVWKLETGEEPPEVIDHHDGDGLNNAFSNLRDGTDGVNARNTCMRKTNTSGYNGVYLTPGNRWRARLRCKDGDISVGGFKQPEEAYKAARKMRLERGFTERHGLPKK